MISLNSKKHSEGLQDIFDKLTPDEVRLLSQFICQNPFVGFYKKALIIYVIFLSLVLLWPFDFFSMGRKNHAKLSDASPGIEFIEEGQAISPESSIPFFERLVNGRGFSLEVWIYPANYEQEGPARIVSYSLNPHQRNFTLGQQGTNLIMRLRTENTNLNGTDPMLIVRNVFAQLQPLHIVVNYNFQEQKVFVNGSIVLISDVPGGNFKNWASDHLLILGNEATGDRPWLGKISYVAIYDYPLDAQEVRRSYHEVRNWISGTGKMGASNMGLLVRYMLDEKEGAGLADSGTLVEPLTLHIPDRIENNKSFLEFSLDRFVVWDPVYSYELILNIILFIPLAFLLHAVLSSHMDGTWRKLFVVIAAGGAITLSVEILQYFSQSRHSSLVDVLANLIGVLIGVQIKMLYDTCLRSNKKIICKAFEKHVTSIHT
jgi:hypothetical protein